MKLGKVEKQILRILYRNFLENRNKSMEWKRKHGGGMTEKELRKDLGRKTSVKYILERLEHEKYLLMTGSRGYKRKLAKGSENLGMKIHVISGGIQVYALSEMGHYLMRNGLSPDVYSDF